MNQSKLIKLAYNRPDLRDAIMPRILLAKGLAKTPEGAKKMWEKYKEKHKNTRKQPADFYEKPEEGEARKEKGDKEKSKADKGKEKNESRQKDQKKKVQKKIYEKDRKRINQKIKNMDSKELQSAIKKLISDQHSHGFGPEKSKHPKDSPEYALEKVKASPYSDEEDKYYAQALVSKNKKETSKKQTERNEAAKDQKKTDKTKKVNDLASKHGISPEGLKKLKSFTKKRNNKLRKDKAEADKDEYKDEIRKTQKSKSTAELKKEFMNNTDPDTRKRVLEMSPAEFEAMMAAISDEEDGGKQASLRTQIIRLAHRRPDLRPKILPLIKEAKTPSYQDYSDKKKRKGEKPLPKEEWETKVLGKKPSEGKKEKSDNNPYAGMSKQELSEKKKAIENAEWSKGKSVSENKKKLEKQKGHIQYLTDVMSGQKKPSGTDFDDDKAREKKLEKAQKELKEIESDLKKSEGEYKEVSEKAKQIDQALKGSSDKKANYLRNKLIRLAHENPEIRKDLLPLLKEATVFDIGRNGGALINNISPKGFEYSFYHSFSPLGVFSEGSGDIQNIYATAHRKAKEFGETVLKGAMVDGNISVDTRLSFYVKDKSIVLQANGSAKLSRANAKRMNKYTIEELQSSFKRMGWEVRIW